MDIPLSDELLKKQICEAISFIHSGDNRIIIDTPFTFPDGDAIKIVLKENDRGRYLSDEGHTFMHLSYNDLDLSKGTKKKILENILSMNYIINSNGELILPLAGEQLGDMLFTFLQGLSKITDLTFLRKDRLKSLFLQEFIEFLKGLLGNRAVFDYVETNKDPNGRYKVDCCVPIRRPVLIFGVNNDDKCRDATITLLKFENWGVKNTSIIIFEEESTLSSRVVPKLLDISGKSFSDLGVAKERLPEYLKEISALSQN
jgi:hypothetical protein